MMGVTALVCLEYEKRERKKRKPKIHGRILGIYMHEPSPIYIDSDGCLDIQVSKYPIACRCYSASLVDELIQTENTSYLSNGKENCCGIMTSSGCHQFGIWHTSNLTIAK